MVGILMAVGYCSFPTPPAPPKLEAVPALTFTTANGEKAAFSDYQGRITLIHFWATWCPPCLVEMPELVALTKQHPELTLLAFSLDKDAATMSRYFKAKFGELSENFVPIWDEKGNIAKNTFYSFNYPETYIVDCQGKIAEKVIGNATDWPERVKPHLAQCKTPAPSND